MLYLETLGRIRLTKGEGRHTIHVPRQSLRLLAFFAMSRGRMHASEAVMEQFWPDCDPDNGRSNLSSAVWRLRRALPEEAKDLLSSDVPGAIGLTDAAPLWSDAETFAHDIEPGLSVTKARLDSAEAQRFWNALRLHVGELLAGCSLEWVLLERERLLQLWIRAQLRWLEHCAAGEEWEAALDAGAMILRHDPLRESLHRRMIELHLANGNPCAASRQYEACARVLKRELGIKPSAATQSAMAAMQSASVPAIRSATRQSEFSAAAVAR